MYRSFRSFSGGLSNVHIPSSAKLAGTRSTAVSNAAEVWRNNVKIFTEFLISIGKTTREFVHWIIYETGRREVSDPGLCRESLAVPTAGSDEPGAR